MIKEDTCGYMSSYYFAKLKISFPLLTPGMEAFFYKGIPNFAASLFLVFLYICVDLFDHHAVGTTTSSIAYRYEGCLILPAASPASSHTPTHLVLASSESRFVSPKLDYVPGIYEYRRQSVVIRYHPTAYRYVCGEPYFEHSNFHLDLLVPHSSTLA